MYYATNVQPEPSSIWEEGRTWLREPARFKVTTEKGGERTMNLKTIINENGGGGAKKKKGRK